MHERSLIQALLNQVQEIANQHASSRVVAIRVRIGEFSGVEPALLSGAYEESVQDSPFSGAALLVERVPLQAVCNSCVHDFAVRRFHFQCPVCGSLKLTLRGGEELMLDSVTLEEVQP